MFAQDPSILATLTPAQLAAINSISDDDLAPPPSEEDIFGKTEALKQQFAEDNDRIAQQMAENEVRCSNTVLQRIQFCCLVIKPSLQHASLAKKSCNLYLCKILLIILFFKIDPSYENMFCKTFSRLG